MISVNEAVARGIRRIRMPQWANPEDHFELPLYPGGKVGVVIKLWSPVQLIPECGLSRPQVLTIFDLGDRDAAVFEPYNGPLPDG